MYYSTLICYLFTSINLNYNIMQDLIGDSYTDIYINIYATAQEELED